MRSFALKSQSAARIRNMIDLARTEMSMALASSSFDVDPWLFNARSGTIDLKNGTQRPHDRDDLISKISPIAYDPNATAPTWDTFLSRVIPDIETVRFLRRAVGYSLTGVVAEQVFFLLYGTGATARNFRS
jgi:putative DNA primase/helicase